MTLKKRLHEIIYSLREQDKTARTFQFGMAALIIINAIAVMLETVEFLNLRYKPIFDFIEWFSVLIFLTEYFVRFWVADLSPIFQQPILGRLRCGY